MFRELAVAYPDAFLPSLAAALNNLVNLICDSGRPLDALALAEEPVRIRRGLAESQPDSFVPELARSLGALARCHEVLGKPREAALRYHESLSVLAPVLERLPKAYSGMAHTFARAYLLSVEDAAVDHPLMNRIGAILMIMNESDREK